MAKNVSEQIKDRTPQIQESQQSPAGNRNIPSSNHIIVKLQREDLKSYQQEETSYPLRKDNQTSNCIFIIDNGNLKT